MLSYAFYNKHDCLFYLYITLIIELTCKWEQIPSQSTVLGDIVSGYQELAEEHPSGWLWQLQQVHTAHAQKQQHSFSGQYHKGQCSGTDSGTGVPATSSSNSRVAPC